MLCVKYYINTCTIYKINDQIKYRNTISIIVRQESNNSIQKYLLTTKSLLKFSKYTITNE